MSGWRWRVAAAAYAFAVTMTGTTLPTPLYGLYRDRLGFSATTQTTIFATYAVGVIVALVLAGQSSDRFGRRPVLLVGLAASALSAVAFLLPVGLETLFTGRLLSGLSAGLFTGTATTALVELAPVAQVRVTSLVATAANILGLGAGPLLAGVLAELAPRPLVTPYLVHLGLLAVAGALTLTQPETVTAPRDQRPPWRPLRPSVPPGVRAAFVPAALSGFAGFATFGVYTALEPRFLAEILGVEGLAAAGAVTALVFVASVVAQAATRDLDTRTALPLGCALLVVGTGVLALSLQLASLGLFLLATVVLGAGHGTSFRAGIASVARTAPPERRGEVTSTLFVVLYVGISLPVVGVGALSQAAGLLTAGLVFAGCVALLALAALVAVLRRPATA